MLFFKLGDDESMKLMIRNMSYTVFTLLMLILGGPFIQTSFINNPITNLTEDTLVNYLGTLNQSRTKIQKPLQSIVKLTLHEPIQIDNDSDFTNQAMINGWPGSGTENNPYIISNYNITTNNREAGIRIANTIQYFIIEQVLVSGTISDFEGAFHFKNAKHGHLRYNVVRNSSIGILLRDSEFFILESNDIQSANVDNTWGLYIEDSANTILINNSVSLFTNSGIYVGDAPNTTLLGNMISDNQRGIYIRDQSSNTIITDNIIENNTGIGIGIRSTVENTIIHNNTFNNNNLGGFQVDDLGTASSYANNTWVWDAQQTPGYFIPVLGYGVSPEITFIIDLVLSVIVILGLGIVGAGLGTLLRKRQSPKNP